MTTRPGEPPVNVDPAALVRELASSVPDTVRMFTAVLRDPRVPRRAKYEAAALVALIATPLSALPIVGEVETAALVTLAARRLTAAAGETVMREHWRGSDRAFEVLMALVASGWRPKAAAWRVLRRR